MRATTLVLLVGLLGCSPVNSTPCAGDDECPADQRCRRGACGPICLDDVECGDGQVCTAAGVCGRRPECAKSEDCAVGFTCTQGECRCDGDAACAANQQCVDGRCEARAACTSDADCASRQEHCEVTQGVCLPACQAAQDCAPNLDARVALALYTCDRGACVRRCVTDVQCGVSGFICRNGMCQAADCTTAADCADGQLCTSATTGRCEPVTLCATTGDCQRNFECRRYETRECPPGFDCSQRVCVELPGCLADADCVEGVPPTRTGYCEEGHCQPSSACLTRAQCNPGQTCVAGGCVPWTCRGHDECAPGKCIDGACAAPPPASSIDVLRLTPRTAFLVAGDSVKLSLLALTVGGLTYPVDSADWEVRTPEGQPGDAVTVAPSGLATAVHAGVVRVRGTVPGASSAAPEATLTVLAAVTSGRRVVVTDEATGAPLAQVAVRACATPACDDAVDVTTGADGAADFPSLGAGPATFTAVPRAVRSDGLPAHERVSVIGTSVTDVRLSLRENPVRAQAGLGASVGFGEVSTSGGYWAGLVAASASDVPSLSAQSLVGDSFMVDVAGLGQVPVPGAVVLYTSPGFGIPQEVKGRALAIAQPGTRWSAAWAGRANLSQALSVRSVDLLSYLGSFDYALQAGTDTVALPFVPDTVDVDGDGRCADAQKCPLGEEDVPDYAHWPTVGFRPQRLQQRRTEVALPQLPAGLDTVLLAAVEVDPQAGMLPVGFASRTAGQGGQPESVTLRSGAPYDAVTLGQPGLWALASNAAGTTSSGRLSRGPSLPEQAQVANFLPALADASYAPATRTFQPGQPTWASVYSAGGRLARVSLTGATTRHVIWFAMSGAQTQVPWPVCPDGPGGDPAAEIDARLEVVALELRAGLTAEGFFSGGGVRPRSLAVDVDGYSRLDR